MTKTKFNTSIFLARIVIVIGYGISIPGLWMMRDNPSVFLISGLFTTLSMALLLMFHQPWKWKFFYILLLIGVLGWIAEVIGTNTGIIFGEYSYGPSLGYKVFGTPISKVVNWMLTIYMIMMVVKRFVKGTTKLVLATAVAMVLYDVMLEPVAIRLYMWSWEAGNPPLHNYLGWLALSIPFAWLLSGRVKGTKNPLVSLLLVCQLVFLTALNFMIHFFGM